MVIRGIFVGLNDLKKGASKIKIGTEYHYVGSSGSTKVPHMRNIRQGFIMSSGLGACPKGKKKPVRRRDG